jgi:hypothetical protein
MDTISDTPSHMYQHTEYLRPVVNAFAWFGSGDLMRLLEEPALSPPPPPLGKGYISSNVFSISWEPNTKTGVVIKLLKVNDRAEQT